MEKLKLHHLSKNFTLLNLLKMINTYFFIPFLEFGFYPLDIAFEIIGLKGVC